MEKTREGVLRFQRIMLESERLKLEDLGKKLSEELDRLSRPQSLEEIILQTVGDEQCVEIDLPSILGGREARIEEIEGNIKRTNKEILDFLKEKMEYIEKEKQKLDEIEQGEGP